MEIVIAWLVLSLVVFGVFVAVVVRGVRAARRGITRARREVRRTLTDAALTARSAQPGLMGELARMRRELRLSLDSTRGTLSAGAGRDPALREALGLLDQLAQHAERLDGELALLMAAEPDRARVSARLPDLRGRTARIRSSADALRQAAQDRARHDDTAGLDALHEQIALEANALRHWSPVTGQITGEQGFGQVTDRGAVRREAVEDGD
ncbi:hypothetical protein [Streptomyces specialis]|uniref:hypothetical protein n=1 Tax=Streptomyces specialis TaxID=498367 RepID=UPI000ACD63CD|nr:hypothetical protein [Streptomyces specialis]